MTWRRNGLLVLVWMIGLHSSVLWGQAPLNFVGIAPCRLVDTRNAVGTFGGPSLPPFTERSFPILSASCGIPATASAYSLNVTVVPAGFLGYLTVWPTGVTQPLASTVNSYLGVAVANAAIVSAGTGGAVSVYGTNTTDVILDIDGYFIGQSTTDTQSTAVGIGALPASSTGFSNTAVGLSALGSNTNGGFNVAVGNSVLAANTTGSSNTAVGNAALQDNTTGGSNTGVGQDALAGNIVGNGNTAVGSSSLSVNVSHSNTAVGAATLVSNTTGSSNTAVGFFALGNVTTGGANIGVGYTAGNSVTNGTANIEIGNSGTNADSNVIRIGTSGTQTTTYIAGIAGASVTGGSAVLVDPVTGQLGILLSSERFKEDVQDMDSASDALMRLRPVTFRYKGAGSEAKNLQYGLIAEEVAAIYPQLAVYGRDGQVESVQYHQLPALLLNEMQKQHETIQRLEERIAELETLLGNKVQPTRIGGN
jgi:hypothetical protein